MPSSQDIKAKAVEMGFDLAGIAPAEPIFPAERALEKWNQAGRAGEMDYMLRFSERATKLSTDFPEARSIIVAGANYHTRSNLVQLQDRPMGSVARYAWGRDYHDVLGRRLEALAGWIEEKSDGTARCLVCVDTRPVLERTVGEIAGMGFRGKTTMLLNRQFGPWILLGEILTTLELEPDKRVPDTCGRCHNCVSACPTGALDEEYVLDAPRCISYLTIEHKGSIPHELRPLIGDRLFGCDDCLQVCPAHEGREETLWHELRPSAGVGPLLSLIPILQIRNNREYRDRFEGTPLMRTGRKRLARNAAIVLGNLRNPEAVPALSEALENDPAPLVRGHAAWALGRIGGEDARLTLERRLEAEEDPAVQEEIKLAMEEVRSTK